MPTLIWDDATAGLFAPSCRSGLATARQQIRQRKNLMEMWQWVCCSVQSR